MSFHLLYFGVLVEITTLSRRLMLLFIALLIGQVWHSAYFLDIYEILKTLVSTLKEAKTSLKTLLLI